MRQFIVVWDPSGDFWEGSVIPQEQASIIKSRGGAVLPCDTRFFRRAGVAGYMRRGWGAGWPLEHHNPMPFCPMTVFLTPQHKEVYWTARIVPADVGRVKETPGILAGTIQLSPDSNQSPQFQTGMMPDSERISVRDLGAIDQYDGWTISGRARIMPTVENYFGFTLYGACPGIRVVWTAMSVLEVPA